MSRQTVVVLIARRSSTLPRGECPHAGFTVVAAYPCYHRTLPRSARVRPLYCCGRNGSWCCVLALTVRHRGIVNALNNAQYGQKNAQKSVSEHISHRSTPSKSQLR